MNEVIEIVKSETGKNTLDQIRAKFDHFIKNEKNLSKQNFHQIVKDGKKTKLVGNTLILSSIIINIILAIVIVTIVLKQLSIITKAANEVTKGNFKHKISIIPNNEFRVLVIAFNKMIDEIESNLNNIKKNEEELNKYKLSLEALVAKKTVDLKIAMEEAERFASFPKNNPNPIIQIDLDGNIMLSNTALDKLFPSIKKQGIEHPLLKDILELNLNSPPINREVIINNIAYYQTITKLKVGKIESLVVYSNDITQIKEAQKQAEKANKLKTEFLANMSHELRTPMHSIITFSRQGIERKDKWSGDEQAENLQLIHDSGERLLSLLNDLLDLSKLEAGAVKYEMDEYDLIENTKMIANQISSLTNEKNIKLDIIPPKSGTTAYYDQSKINQVILNLLSNAIKFSKNGKTITVIFKNKKSKNPHIKVSVIDEGIGIHSNELSSVFDKFIQSSKTKSGAGGTGLGLAICKEIIAAHKGKIWAENNNKGGATLSFTLPTKK